MAVANDIDVARAELAIGEIEWARVCSISRSAELKDVASRQVLESAALLLRVAQCDSTEDGQAAARWLTRMGFALAMGVGAVEVMRARINGGMGAVAPMVTTVVAGRSSQSRT